MTNEEQLLIAIKADTTNLMSGLKTASTGIGNFSKKIAGIGKGMTIAGAAITAGFAMAIKTASGFEQSMANVASVAGATKEELKLLSDAARKQGEESIYSASQAADAMYYLGSAGMEVNEIIGALAGTMSLAAATGSELDETSESVAATLSQYNLEAEEAGRVSNVFAAAISGSQATMDKLKDSMILVGPLAKSMGISLEETVGILMNLYNAGLKGSGAGTALRMAFAKLLDPTKATADTMERLGVAITDSSGQMRPFKDIIADLGKVSLTAGDAVQIFGVRAGPGMLALVSQGQGAIENMTEAVTGTQKATEMTGMQIDTFQGSMKLLKSAFEEFQITLVQDLMPALRPFIERITEIIKQVSNWIKENPKLAATITKIAAVIGGIAVVGGPLLMAAAGFGAITTAIAAIGTVATGPIGLLIAAVGVAYLAFKNWDKIVEFFKGLVSKVKNIFGGLAKSMLEWGKNAIGGFIEGIKSKISGLTETIKGMGTKIKNLLGFKSPPKEGPLSDSDTWMPNMMKMIGKGITDNQEEVITPINNMVENISATITNFTKEGAAAAIAGIKMHFKPMINDLINDANRATGIFKQIAEANLARIRKTMNDQIDVIKYGLDVYNNAMSQMGSGGGGGSMMPTYSPPVNEGGGGNAGGGGGYFGGSKSVRNTYSPSIVVNVSGGGNAADIKRAVQEALDENNRQYFRQGKEILLGA